MMRSILLLTALLSTVVAFAPTLNVRPSSTALGMANDEDLLRWAKSSRSADVNDRVVELKRPLGLVLQEDDDGNVYVETVAPKGNAGRSGQVRSDVVACDDPCQCSDETDESFKRKVERGLLSVPKQSL